VKNFVAPRNLKMHHVQRIETTAFCFPQEFGYIEFTIDAKKVWHSFLCPLYFSPPLNQINDAVDQFDHDNHRRHIIYTNLEIGTDIACLP